MDEVERRRLKWRSIKRAWDADPAAGHKPGPSAQVRAERAAEALKFLDELRRTNDVGAFSQSMQDWSKRPGIARRGGGIMFIEQLIQATADAPVAADLLGDVLTAPRSEADAAEKIRRCVAHVEKVRQGAKPAPKRSAYVLSLLWSMAEPDQWPCIWPSAADTLKTFGWLPAPEDLDRWYLEYREIVITSGLSVVETEDLLWWIEDSNPFTGLDPALVDRCRENVALAQAWKQNDSTYPTTADAAAAERNIRAINGELKMVGALLEDRVGAALGRKVVTRPLGPKYSSTTCFRSDSYIAWQTGGTTDEPSLWLWAGDEGVAFGLHPGWRERGWTKAVARGLTGHIPAGMEFLKWRDQFGGRVEPAGLGDPGGQFLVGRFFPDDSALDDPEFADELERVAASLQPVLDRVLALRGGTSELADLVARFRAERPYPTPNDAKQVDDRAELAGSLTATALEELDTNAFSQIINTGRYGGPGPQANLNRALGEASPARLAELAAAFKYLLWDDTEPVAARIDRLVNQEDLGLKGLGEAVVMKLLAIAHPAEFIPAFPYRGDRGKKLMMERLGLPPLDEKQLSRGDLQVESNDQLKQLLDPYFADDPWGAAMFLFWLIEGEQEIGPTPPVDVNRITDPDLTELGDELLVGDAFLDEVRSLLAEKGQVIFYGPPGTGKTYIAKRLAETLVADSSRRTIVQFHPSTSYEDFFEGYRPVTNADGAMFYELTHGPLARMAELATKSPNVDHIMIIDEINRANLPKVFGELLFLLEYRKESVQLLNRPEEPFSLPQNLYFIGTMNTADRSIALVDAALRRRFHFVPFFLEQDQMEGLLAQWLARNGGDVRIARLVEQVNQELVQDVGEHLQIGPSYFMKPGISEGDLRRIWKYSIEPYVEEQLFGQTSEIKNYKWDEVRQRLWGRAIEAPEGASEDELLQPVVAPTDQP